MLYFANSLDNPYTPAIIPAPCLSGILTELGIYYIFIIIISSIKLIVLK
ncbi:MAG: hypothetical protein ACTSWG_04345 [Candidatus Helarchaeota archaeon]